jgi:hypothetical protein
MISIKLFLPVLLFPSIIMVSCSKPVSSTTSVKDNKPPAKMAALSPCIIYKTKADYRMNVPVTLSEDKTRIVSYPDILDIRNQGGSVYPTELVNGFLLDNRGIGPNVAFLSYTYDDYSRLTRTPSMVELMNHIIDKDPVTEMYRCGTRNNTADWVSQLKHAIETGKMAGFVRIK